MEPFGFWVESAVAWVRTVWGTEVFWGITWGMLATAVGAVMTGLTALWRQMSIKHVKKENDKKFDELNKELSRLRRGIIEARLHRLESGVRALSVRRADSGHPIGEVERLRKKLDAAPGAGRTTACLILALDDIDDAEDVLHTFKGVQHRSDEAYPYAALAVATIAGENPLFAEQILRDIPETVPQSEINDALDYALKVRSGRTTNGSHAD